MSEPSPASSPASDLLRRTHAGDRAALEALLVRELPYVRERVHRRLGPALRGAAGVETGDVVQEALIRVLEHGPRFTIADESRLRALLARIVENVIRDGFDRASALRRGARRVKPLSGDSALRIDPPAASPTRPSVAAGEREERAWIPLALQLLEPDERRVLVEREWDGRSFAELGSALGVSEDAARMRYGRALSRLARAVAALRAGRLDEWLPEGAA
jgi:RNA polymerase sigma-70 factor (ECF subfamily)